MRRREFIEGSALALTGTLVSRRRGVRLQATINPVLAGVPLTFTLTYSGGSQSAVKYTDTQGIASASFNLKPRVAGPQQGYVTGVVNGVVVKATVQCNC